MCYYNGQRISKEEYIRLKHLEKRVADYPFLYRDVISGFDFGKTAVVKPRTHEQDVDIVQMEWGFIPDAQAWPYWETREQVNLGRIPRKDASGKMVDGLHLLNAVSEELLLPRKIFRQAALHRPCLFLSSGYYEWRHVYLPNKRTGELRKTAERFPYRVYMADQPYFFIAGIWQEWMDAETGEIVESAAMITTEANELAREIHTTKKRQPAILTEDLAWEWLFGERTEARIQEIARYQIPYQQMRYYTLARDFLNAADPLSRHVYHDLPPLEVPGGDLSYEPPPSPSSTQTSLF